MRLPEMDKLMKAWGEWTTQREEGTRGYPKSAPYTKVVPSATTPGRLPEDPIFSEVDQIMCELKAYCSKITKKTDPDYRLYRIGWLWYAANLPEGRIMTLCRINITTLYNKLFRLRGLVAAKMSERRK